MRPFALAACLVSAFTIPAVAQVDKDVEDALATVRTRAAAGDAVAQFCLGTILYYGTPQTAEAVEWFLKAARQGYAPAEFQVGQLYDFGFGVQADDAVALGWYRGAAAHGSAAAQRAVGEFYKRGRSVEVDLAEAARWLRQAAEHDDLRAQYQLGQLYFDGTGVARDYASAYFWFAVAAGQTPLIDNRKQLIELRNIAAIRMGPDALPEATRRVSAWKPAR